jgi:3-mercaptopyruvate sulfurtransferase SseA
MCGATIDAFHATMQRLGIDNDATVVVYDPVGGYMGAALVAAALLRP